MIMMSTLMLILPEQYQVFEYLQNLFQPILMHNVSALLEMHLFKAFVSLGTSHILTVPYLNYVTK